MQAVVSSWLDWGKTFLNQKTKLYLAGMITCDGILSPRNEKTLPLRKAVGSTSRSKQREGQKENKTLFRVFAIFVLLLAIIMQHL